MSKNDGREGMDRRRFLMVGAGGLAGLFFIPTLGGCDSHSVTSFTTGASAPFLTPVDRFFVQNGGQGSIEGWVQPNFPSSADWSLKLKAPGGIDVDFSFADIQRLAAGSEKTLLKTIECILQSEIRTTATGDTGTAYWTGIGLTQLLDDAGVDYSENSRMRQLIFTGDDGFVNNITVERLRSTELVEPILAYRMNGVDLPPEHGFPVRLIIQEGYGYKNVKWLTEIEAINFVGDFGTYQAQGFVDDGIMRVNTRATSLFDGVELPAGPITILGFSLSGFAPIEKVEISIDGGDFAAADIVPFDRLRREANLPESILQIAEADEYPFLGVWTPWEYQWEAPSGAHTIAIRATDAEGNIQPEIDDDQFDGKTGIARYNVVAR